MSLLLALTAGGPPPTIRPVARLTPADRLDQGAATIGGVIRLGIIATAIIAPCIVGPRLVAPEPLLRPRITTGYVVSVAPTAPTPAIRITSTLVESVEPEILRPRISTGYVVAEPPPPATFAQRLVPVALASEPSFTGHISPALYRGPPLVPERHLRALLDEQPALVGQVRAVATSSVVVVSWITAPTVLESPPRIAGRIMAAPAGVGVDTQSGTAETFLIISTVRSSLASSCSTTIVTVGTSTAAAQPSPSTRLTRSSITTETA